MIITPSVPKNKTFCFFRFIAFAMQRLIIWNTKSTYKIHFQIIGHISFVKSAICDFGKL